MRKWVSIVLMLLLLSLAGTVLAAERVPLRVAVLPVLDQTGGWLDRDGAAMLSARLQQEFYVPLNDTLQAVVYVPQTEVLAAYNSLVLDARTQGKKLTLEDTLTQLALKLPADLVLNLAVDSWYERTYINWEGDSCTEASASLTLYGWNQRTQQPIRENASRWVNDDTSAVGGVDQQGSEALDELLGKLQLRKLIFPLQGK